MASILAHPHSPSIDSRPEPKKHKLAWRRTGGRCWYCGVHLDPNRFQMDHVIPQSKGGTGMRNNLVICCPGCNAAKRDKSVEEFRAMYSRRASGVPYFSTKQRSWLRDRLGVEIPDGEPHSFWFEEEGLEL